jgi:hypothetical protein
MSLCPRKRAEYAMLKITARRKKNIVIASRINYRIGE